MEDFADLIFMSLAFFFMFFFVLAVFQTDKDAKSDATKAELDFFRSDLSLIDYLNYPAVLNGREMRMKEIIFDAVNANDEELFQQKTREYFQQRGFEGTVLVYETNAYQSGGLPLFSETNGFSSGGRSEATLQDKQFGFITIVMQG